MSSPVTVCHQEFDESHFLASEYEPARPEQAAFHIIPVPLEQSVSYGGGTAHGPAAILSASQQLEAWDGISAPGAAGLYTAPAAARRKKGGQRIIGMHRRPGGRGPVPRPGRGL